MHKIIEVERGVDDDANSSNDLPDCARAHAGTSQ